MVIKRMSALVKMSVECNVWVISITRRLMRERERALHAGEEGKYERATARSVFAP